MQNEPLRVESKKGDLLHEEKKIDDLEKLIDSSTRSRLE